LLPLHPRLGLLERALLQALIRRQGEYQQFEKPAHWFE
jgi:hypothetical protein